MGEEFLSTRIWTALSGYGCSPMKQSAAGEFVELLVSDLISNQQIWKPSGEWPSNRPSNRLSHVVSVCQKFYWTGFQQNMEGNIVLSLRHWLAIQLIDDFLVSHTRPWSVQRQWELSSLTRIRRWICHRIQWGWSQLPMHAWGATV